MQAHPTVTIGFYPRERFGAAADSLRSIVTKTAGVSYELLIVDCATPERYLQEMKVAVDGVTNVRWLHVKHFLQPNESKNMIAREATGEFVCFIENDNIVSEGWLSALLDGLQETGAAVAFPLLREGPTWKGKVHHDRGFLDIRAREAEGRLTYEVIEGSSAQINAWSKETAPRLVTTTENHVTIYGRHALEKMLPFNEAYLVNTGVDVSFRLLELGIPLAFVPRSKVNHYPPAFIGRDERAFYLWRWRMEPIVEGERQLRAAREVKNLPDAADFARGQHYRTNPFIWIAYRALRIPRWMLLKIRKDRFLRDSSAFFVASTFASALNYSFHPLLGRVLSMEDYGEVQTIIALYGSMAVFLGVFTQLNVNIVANADGHDHADVTHRAQLIASLRGLAYAAGFGLALAVLLASPLIAKFFRLQSALPVALMSLFFVTGVLMLFRRSALRGMRDFRSSSIAQITEAGGRIVFACALAYAGFRVAGVIVGIAIGQAAVFAFVYAKTRGMPLLAVRPRLSFGPEVREELKYATLILVSSFVTTALFTADMLVVKRYFSPAEAGLYGGVSTIARIVLYAAGAVGTVLAPSVRLRNTRAENERLLAKALTVTALIGASALAAFAVAPRFFVVLLMGQRYASEAALLPKLGVVLFLLSLVNPLFQYHLALRERFVAAYGAVALAAVVALCAWDHASFEAIVRNFGLVSAGLLVAFAVRHYSRRTTDVA